MRRGREGRGRDEGIKVCQSRVAKEIKILCFLLFSSTGTANSWFWRWSLTLIFGFPHCVSWYSVAGRHSFFFGKVWGFRTVVLVPSCTQAPECVCVCVCHFSLPSPLVTI